MSRLYNTLEKIRTGEQGAFSAKKSAPATGLGQKASASKKRWIVLLGVAALLALALIVFFVGLQRKNLKMPVIADAIAPREISGHPPDSAPKTDVPPKIAAPAPPVSTAASPAGTGAALYQELNERGIALIQKNQHWQGIYSLEQAHKLQPERPEALINMAVALAELGLRAPAQRLFSQAHALAPNHLQLRKNLELLGQADFFDPQWLSSLTAGQVQPGQTTQPQ